MNKGKIEFPPTGNIKWYNDKKDIASLFLLREGIETLSSEVFKLKDIAVKSSKGNAGVAKVLSRLGIGTNLKFPLPHSGFQVTMSVIGSVDKLDVLDRVNEEVRAGNINTLGTVTSGHDSVLGNIILDIFDEHLVSSTLDVPKDEIMHHIDFRDIETIKLAVLAGLNPTGIDSDVTCIGCNKPHAFKADLKEMSYVDFSRVPETGHILKRSKARSVSLEDIKLYKEEVNRKATKELGNGISIRVNGRDVLSYLTDTKMWMEEVIRIVNRSITSEIDERELQRSKQSIMQLTHIASLMSYIDAVIIDGEEITDRASLLRILNGVVEDTELVVKLSDILKEYITSSTVGYIGIIAFNCDDEKCKTENTGTLEKEIIPINGSQFFLEVSTQIQLSMMQKTT